MNWYLAKIIYRIICGEGNHRAQFDEQLRLVRAENKIAAIEKAELLGRHEEDVFLNKRQQLVQWQFAGVSELYKLSELVDGAEIYSKIVEEDAEHYIPILNKKSAQLKLSNSHELLGLV